MILGLILAFGIFWSKADDCPISRPRKIRSKIKVLKFGLSSGKYDIFDLILIAVLNSNLFLKEINNFWLSSRFAWQLYNFKFSQTTTTWRNYAVVVIKIAIIVQASLYFFLLWSHNKPANSI